MNWSDKRPTEPGDYWVSIHPSLRGQDEWDTTDESVTPVKVSSGAYGLTVMSEGFEWEVPIPTDHGYLEGAKWARRETPADPFASDGLTDLLALARNEGWDTSPDKPKGLRIGDILSNGWASNRNPLKLFMFLGMTKTSFRGISIDGRDAGPCRRDNRVKLVLSRDTPDLWRTWEALAKRLLTEADEVTNANR